MNTITLNEVNLITGVISAFESMQTFYPDMNTDELFLERIEIVKRELDWE